MHCNEDENPIYVFPEMKLCGPAHNYYIRVSVSNLYNPRIAHECGNWDTEHYTKILF
jgi:hypothetical protein